MESSPTTAAGNPRVLFLDQFVQWLADQPGVQGAAVEPKIGGADEADLVTFQHAGIGPMRITIWR